MTNGKMLLCIGCLMGLSVNLPQAFADEIDPGYDLFTTIAGPYTFAKVPGFGTIRFKGVPVGPGTVDTIVQRLNGINPFPVGDSGVIDIRLDVLSLESVAPVRLPGGTLADVYATINALPALYPKLPQPDSLSPSTGTMTVYHGFPDGGSYDASFSVNADLIFTKVGGNPDIAADRLFTMAAPSYTLDAVNSPWLDLPVPGDDRHTADLPAGNFYALNKKDDLLVVPVTSCTGVGDANRALMVGHQIKSCDNPFEIIAPVPEPSSILLISSAAAGLLAYFWRRRRAANATDARASDSSAP
jgi:hypothetical protein